MALSRGRKREAPNIWPGFVDAMTALLMVMMFVLTIFMIVQFTLRETINTKEDELASLADQVAGLADALGLERARTSDLSADLAGAQSEAAAQATLIATLTAQVADREAGLSAAAARIASFEAQVATLLSERDAARGEVAALTGEKARLTDANAALDLAVAKAREEIDAQTEAARLAAARREALDALIADLRARNAAAAAGLAETTSALGEAEAARLADAAAAEALRARLTGAEDELTAMTLALEQERRRAEETLTLLAAAEAAREDLDARLAEVLAERSTAEAQLSADREGLARDLAAALAAKRAAEGATRDALSDADRQKLLLATANARLDEERAASAEAARKVALLNQQLSALRGQLGSLQALLDASAAKDLDAKVQIESLGSQLNSALARVAAEEKRRAALEEAERLRLQSEAAALKAETQELARYRSEFFGKLSEVLDGRDGVRIVGDRFVFSSEVLFEPGSADLSPEGESQIAGVAATLQEVAAVIPPEIDWIIRVDGHTDDVPLSGTGEFRDNWALSTGRALSVVRYMQESLGFPPSRMAATGFGEYRPVAEGEDAVARAQNRRIELKLTER